MAQPVVGTEPFRPDSPAYLADPYTHLAALRAEGPCYVDPGSGRWFVLTYDDVEVGLSHVLRGEPEGPNRNVHFPDNPFRADGPGHTEPRRLIAPALTNRAVQRYRDRAQAIVDRALAGKGDGAELRVVEEIGFELPYRMTCELLGIPEVDDPAELRAWTWKSLELIDAFLNDEQLHEDLTAAACLAEHVNDVAAWKRGHLGDDVFSTVIRAADEGRVMRPDQVVPYIHTLYLAGMHTTVNQTSLSLLAILERRDQWELLRSRPDLLENAVEELLRFEPTAQYMRRTAMTDIELGDITVRTGTDLVCWIASANRDERRWGDTADELDITRPDARQHLAFGKGAHVCIGSWLARMELEVVLRTVLERYPETVVAEQDLVWSSNVIRGPEELLLRLGSA